MTDPDSPGSPARGQTREADRQRIDPVASGIESSPTIDVGVLVASAETRADRDRLFDFTRRLAGDVVDELATATDAGWQFHFEEPTTLADGSPHRPSEFLDDAALRMVEGPYDVVVVVTDVPLLSRRHRRVPGLASPVSRVAVVSTRHLRATGRDEPPRSLDAPAVRYNGDALVLHEIGHVLGAPDDPGSDGIMAPFGFDPDLRSVPPFDVAAGRYLERIAASVPEAEEETRSVAGLVGFHLVSVARNPGQLVRSLLTSRAPLLPLSLPKLSTAAVAPTIILVFSAETWDVGLHLDNLTALVFAATSILLAGAYVVFSLNLNVPRKRRAVVTEHVALLNVTILAILAFAMVGLFALVLGIMLVIEFLLFPPDLMTNWPTLEDPTVTVVDIVRIGAFVSTIGVLSGALAGGLEDRTILRHLALFRRRP